MRALELIKFNTFMFSCTSVLTTFRFHQFNIFSRHVLRHSFIFHFLGKRLCSDFQGTNSPRHVEVASHIYNLKWYSDQNEYNKFHNTIPFFSAAAFHHSSLYIRNTENVFNVYVYNKNGS